MTLSRQFNAQAARTGTGNAIREKEDESARAGHVFLSRFWSGGRKRAAGEPEIPLLQPTALENRLQRAREAVAIRLLRAPRAP